MRRKTVEGPRCANGSHCIAFPVLREPAKLSRSNPGPICFACEERRTASELKRATANEQAVQQAVQQAAERRNANERPWANSNEPVEKSANREHTELQRAREVLELRRRSVLTCEEGLRSALAGGEERLVRRWSRSLREAEARLAWAEGDLVRAERRVRSKHAS